MSTKDQLRVACQGGRSSLGTFYGCGKLTRRHGVGALGAALLCVGSVQAADVGPPANTATADALQPIIVTGSLIPRVQLETSTPITVITAEDIQLRGFSSVADALKQSAFANGSVEGEQFDFGFTSAAQTLSMFGLSPSFVKYLIDGRPMANYPALYGGTDVISTLGGIPTTLVDHIDILPGGQSSLYGSDAIAGVVNIVLKKSLQAPTLDARYGFYQDGGGVSKRVTLADGFQWGTTSILAGVQYEKKSPIWGYQRDLTASYYNGGTSPATAERDFLVFGTYGGGGNGTYYFLDPKNCAGAASLFGGSIQKYARDGLGEYCGTKKAGYYTLANAADSVQGYLHGTHELSDRQNLYADFLLSHDVQRFSNGAYEWSTDFYDPNLDDVIFLQRRFSPEEAGGLDNKKISVADTAYRVTGGWNGTVGTHHWDYDISLSHTQEHLSKRTFALKVAAMNAFFSSILGPDNGPDPYFNFYPTYTPNYAAFYTPLTPSQYDSIGAYARSRSKTSDNLLRAQLTDASLFALPGGQAGLAVVVEGGNQEWRFNPDQALVDGEYRDYTSVVGGGRRSRYAATTELRLPLHKVLTLNLSGRYDVYRVSGASVDKGTYNLGLEFRPVPSLLLRGRAGTAFKAPSLPDEFQGRTRYGGAGTDYYQCALAGYTGSNVGNCPHYLDFFSTITAGNPALKPITAKVWNAGFVWQPFAHASVNVDYLHWDIRNETSLQSTDQILQTESLCRLGTYDIHSPTCVAAIAQVTRDQLGNVQQINAPKINVSREALGALTLGAQYHAELGLAGTLDVQGSWSDMSKHIYQQYPNDPILDALRDPIFSTDFKSKANASLTWSKAHWSVTTYVARYGRSPNFIARNYGYGEPGAGDLAPWTVCNLTASFQPVRALTLSIALNNAFNRQPPADHTVPGTENFPYNDYNYNVYGRQYYGSLVYQWGQ